MNVLVRKFDRSVPDAWLSDFAHDVLSGLRATPKRLSPKYFYDERGSDLFEQITTLDAYYPTRCELQILKRHAREIAALIPTGAALIEFGSGASTKTRLLLEAHPGIAAYVPVEISADFLDAQAALLRRDFPNLAVLPVAADFTQPFALPKEIEAMPKAGFFPGSTIGNMDPVAAAEFLLHAGRLLGPGAVMIVGVDLVKDETVLERAYDDPQGVTAAFNRNILTRINRELGATFDVANFAHHAFFNREASRIEMHLASPIRHDVTVCGERIRFRAGETIHTENSYKYTGETFAALAQAGGWTPVVQWTDDRGYFSVQALRLP